MYWDTTEREFQDYALYYGMPTVSIRGCCFHKMRRQEEGFIPAILRRDNPEGNKDKSFFWDEVHPDGRSGAR